MTDNWYQDWKSRPLVDRLEKLPRGLGIIETVDLCREAATALRECEAACNEKWKARLADAVQTAAVAAYERAAMEAEGWVDGFALASRIRSLAKQKE